MALAGELEEAQTKQLELEVKSIIKLTAR